MVNQAKTVGVLMIVNGVITILMGAYYGFVGAMFFAVPGVGPIGPGVPVWVFPTVVGVLGILMVTVGLLNAISGFRIMSFRGRTLAVAALISNAATVFSCYCSVTALGMMIYGLVVLCNSDVADACERVRRGASPNDVLHDFYRRRIDDYDRRNRVEDDYDEWDRSRRNRHDDRGADRDGFKDRF